VKKLQSGHLSGHLSGHYGPITLDNAAYTGYPAIYPGPLALNSAADTGLLGKLLIDYAVAIADDVRPIGHE